MRGKIRGNILVKILVKSVSTPREKSLEGLLSMLRVVC